MVDDTRTVASSPDRFAAVAEGLCAGARVTAVRRLTGGVSADVHALDVDFPDGDGRTVVVRRHGAAGWKPRDGQVAEREYALLGFLHRSGVPVPEPLLLDLSARALPGAYLILEFVEGSTDLTEAQLEVCLDVMAETLAHIHALPVEKAPALPARLDPLPEVFEYLPDGAEWEALRAYLHRCADSRYTGKPVVLHGDYWPGNLLWEDGRLTAILDWEDAALGDPMVDVAGCRLELLWKYGPAATQRFTDAYARQRPVDLRRLALWEVFVASAAAHFLHAWGLEPEREAAMRNQGLAFVRAAADELGS